MRSIATTMLLACGLLFGSAARAEVVNVYTSANFAPLMLGDGRGIYPDLVSHMNSLHLEGYTFSLRYLPRRRLQVKLEEGSLDGIVIGMMPEWLADPAQEKYLWTAPFATDRFVLVSLDSRPPTSRPLAPLVPRTAPTQCKPGAFAGASVGVTTGYVYPGLDDWFASAHLQRRDGASDEKNIEKLLLERVDCVIVAESMARYFMRTHKLNARLRIVPMPGPGTERRFLVQHRDARLYEVLAPAVRRLRGDAAWRRASVAYE
ncbi:substrate-binding periplasmic protein [Massilia sp. TWP1-3-3]|uniref:substrate-binding periplasmic protein n=1 Tax=Massilia sp. TWP1-3-3 TaxID=2804573 RepID=UPI003CEE929F